MEGLWKKDANKTSDKLQYANYKKRLGTKNVTTSFDEWQEMKYNRAGEYDSLKKTYTVIGEIDRKPWTNNFKDKAKQ